MRGEIERCWLFTYREPLESVAALLPAPLAAVTRGIIVHSSNHDKRRHKRIERQLAEAQKKAGAAIKAEQRDTYSCEKDARAALDKLQKTHRGELWEIHGELEPKNIYAPGRAAAGKERKVRRTYYRLRCDARENLELTARLRAHAGCFVLRSNAPEPGVDPAIPEQNHGEPTGPRTWTATQCLRAYKEQHGVESSFAFLKEPLIVNDVFLKKPGRIDALGLDHRIFTTPPGKNNTKPMKT